MSPSHPRPHPRSWNYSSSSPDRVTGLCSRAVPGQLHWPRPGLRSRSGRGDSSSRSQCTVWPGLARTGIGATARRNEIPADGSGERGLLGPLDAYLQSLEARIGALEAKLSASTLMTTAEVAQYARVGVETIQRAIRTGDLTAAGYVGRSPRLSRDAVDGWLANRPPATVPVSSRRRRRCGRKASDAVEAAWQELR